VTSPFRKGEKFKFVRQQSQNGGLPFMTYAPAERKRRLAAATPVKRAGARNRYVEKNFFHF